MLKKVLIGVGIFVVVIVAALFFLNNRNRTLSPAGSAELANGTLKVSVSYSRPSVRERVIFGTKESGALQPYGQYWRLGANEPTIVTFNQDVTFNGNPLKAGSYWMFAIPGGAEFEIGLNGDVPMWGASEPDYSKDVLRTKVPVQTQGSITEQHTITLEAGDNGVDIKAAFEKISFVVPIRPAP